VAGPGTAPLADVIDSALAATRSGLATLVWRWGWPPTISPGYPKTTLPSPSAR